MITLHDDCNILKTTKDISGKTVNSDPIPTKCRVKEEYKMVRNNASQEVVSELEFWIYPNTAISLENKIEYQGKEYQIISIQPKKNTLGETTRKVVFV
jgi:hypothetical protein